MDTTGVGGAIGALGICYDMKVCPAPQFQPPFFFFLFLVRNVTGLIKQLVRYREHDFAVQVILKKKKREREADRKRGREREAGTHLLLATGMETVAVDFSSVPFGMSSSFFIRPHHPPPPTPNHPLRSLSLLLLVQLKIECEKKKGRQTNTKIYTNFLAIDFVCL